LNRAPRGTLTPQPEAVGKPGAGPVFSGMRSSAIDVTLVVESSWISTPSTFSFVRLRCSVAALGLNTTHVVTALSTASAVVPVIVALLPDASTCTVMLGSLRHAGFTTNDPRPENGTKNFAVGRDDVCDCAFFSRLVMLSSEDALLSALSGPDTGAPVMWYALMFDGSGAYVAVTTVAVVAGGGAGVGAGVAGVAVVVEVVGAGAVVVEVVVVVVPAVVVDGVAVVEGATVDVVVVVVVDVVVVAVGASVEVVVVAVGVVVVVVAMAVVVDVVVVEVVVGGGCVRDRVTAAVRSAVWLADHVSVTLAVGSAVRLADHVSVTLAVGSAVRLADNERVTVVVRSAVPVAVPVKRCGVDDLD